jgi:hypothetical protein
MVASTFTGGPAPAFKILSLLAFAATVGCHAAESKDGARTQPTSTAMSGSAPATATALAGDLASKPAAHDSAMDATGCAEHGGSMCGAAERAARGESAAPTASSGANGVGKYGAPLGAAPSESLASVLAEPSRYAGQPLRVEGHVRRACTAMGCWMELAESADEGAPACRVIMKDHAFFVPTNAAGSSARVEGTLAVRHIDSAQVAHMEREGAAFPQKAADGSADELRFVASGVELWRGS